MIYKMFAVMAFVIVLSILGACQTIYVSGDVSGIWEADTVMVIGPARVLPADSLTIEPGTEVYFETDYNETWLQVEGVLLALGQPGDSILFTSTSDYGMWHIEVVNSGYGRFAYCRIIRGYWPYGDGGGIYCDYSTIWLNHCRIDSCGALDDGGAIYCNYSNLTITNSIIANNHLGDLPENPGASGGGICCLHCYDVQIANNRILNNSAGAFSFRQAFAYGGGIYVGQGYEIGIIENNLIAGNIVSSYCEYGGYSYGGGISCDWARLNNNTIVGNGAYANEGGYSVGGGGITAGSDCLIRNCIVWDNVADSFPQIHGGPNVTYSCIDGGWPGFANFDNDPLFCDVFDRDYHIAQNSPCVHGGINNSLVGAFGVGCDSMTSISDETVALPDKFKLRGCWPNPFNSAINVEYFLPGQAYATIAVYDVMGRLVEIIETGLQSQGLHQVTWTAKNCPSGLYFCRLTSGSDEITEKIVLLK